MYRKHQGSGKSLRNERLAQLSEQENVIEKKKKEILAKLEAQKKKDTKTLEYLESSKVASDVISEEKIEPFKKQAASGGEKFIGQEKPVYQRNAFSNDGSFLDQFKKLSSGLHQNLDFVTSFQMSGNKEDPSGDGTSRKNKDRVKELMNDRQRRGQFSNEERQISNKNLQYSKFKVDLSSATGKFYESSTTKETENEACNVSQTILQPDNDLSRHDAHLSEEASFVNDVQDTFEVCNKKVVIESGNIKQLDHIKSDQISALMSYNTVKLSMVSSALTNNGGENNHVGHLDVEISEGGERSRSFDLTSTERMLFDETMKKKGSVRNKNCADEEQTADIKRGSRSSECGCSDLEHNCNEGSQCYGKLSCELQTGNNKQTNHYLSVNEKEKNSFIEKSNVATNKAVSEICENLGSNDSSAIDRRKRKRKSRWGDEIPKGDSPNNAAAGCNVSTNPNLLQAPSVGKSVMLSKVTRSDPGLIQYARQTFGSTNLSEEDWKKAEDHYKINLLYQDMVKKRAEIERLEKAGKFKYEYDSDEDVEGGTWEHKLRQQEMMATQLWADELTRQAAGKHHIGDFLPPEELEKFMEKYNAVKQGRNPDLSDYKEFKLKEDNVGYRLLQKMGWNEGQGLGQGGAGITNPVNKAATRHENQGLGINRPDGLEAGDDEYDAYRKRMMLAYRFRPNPLNNPRRPYY